MIESQAGSASFGFTVFGPSCLLPPPFWWSVFGSFLGLGAAKRPNPFFGQAVPRVLKFQLLERGDRLNIKHKSTVFPHGTGVYGADQVVSEL